LVAQMLLAADAWALDEYFSKEGRVIGSTALIEA
jgi:hypothetical protein